MFRRLLKSLSAAVALLTLALPAAACVQDERCCPERAPVPCAECPAITRGDTEPGAVCATTTAVAAATAVSGSGLGSADVSLPPQEAEPADITLTAPRASRRGPENFRAVDARPRATTPTFLATRRLRI